MTTDNRQILVLGLGNTLLTDEQVGVRVAEAVGSDPRAAALGIRALVGIQPERLTVGEAMTPAVAAAVAPAAEAVLALVAGWVGQL